MSGIVYPFILASGVPADGIPAYFCRAWVNFNGTGTVAIRSSANVSSITDNGTGDYTVNFSSAMPDANYCISAVVSPYLATSPGLLCAPGSYLSGYTAPTTTSVRVGAAFYNAAGAYDPTSVSVAINR